MVAKRTMLWQIKLPVSLPPLRLPKGFLTQIGASLFSLFSDNVVKTFERQFNLMSGEWALATPSARGGLFFVLKALRSEEKKEVVLSAYNFPAIPAVIRAAGMIPVFVDIDAKTLNLESGPIADKISDRTAAVLVTHMYGLQCDMKSILSLTEPLHIPVIEDCAHVLQATFSRGEVGTLGIASIYSFGLSKPLPCGGGGMVIVRDRSLAAKLRCSLGALKKSPLKQQLSTVAKAAALSIVTAPIVYPYITRPLLSIARALGTNLADKVFEEAGVLDVKEPCFNLSPVQAALGISYLPLLEVITQRRIRNAEMLSSILGKKIAPHVPETSTHTYMQYAVRVNQRERFRRSLMKHGILTRTSYILNCADDKRLVPGAEVAEEEVVYLPLYARMTPVEVQFLAQVVLETIT